MDGVEGHLVEPQDSNGAHQPSPAGQAAPSASKAQPFEPITARSASPPGTVGHRLQHVHPQPNQLQSLPTALGHMPLKGDARPLQNGVPSGGPGQASGQGQPWIGQPSGQAPLPQRMPVHHDAPGFTQFLADQ
ncbi:hypothetical protein COCSUDRAFT_68347, partial [Coccomyxa subellipsoidea C-169]